MAAIQTDYPIKPCGVELHFEGDLGGSEIKNGTLSNPKSGKAIYGAAVKGTTPAKSA